MHEWALAESILVAAIEAAEKEGLKKVREINIGIGELQQISMDAFEFALEFSRNSSKYVISPYKAGLEGYDNWIRILKEDKLHAIGTPYNAAVWAECREFAAKFLIEAKEKIGRGYERLFDDAIAHYKIVADHLEKVRETFPFCEMKPEYLKDRSRRSESVEHLKEAKRAEEYCLILLRKIYKEL